MTKEKHFLLGDVSIGAEGIKETVLLGEFDTPDDAVEKANWMFEDRSLGDPTFTRPINIFLVTGTKISLELRETIQITKE